MRLPSGSGVFRADDVAGHFLGIEDRIDEVVDGDVTRGLKVTLKHRAVCAAGVREHHNLALAVTVGDFDRVV